MSIQTTQAETLNTDLQFFNMYLLAKEPRVTRGISLKSNFKENKFDFKKNFEFFKPMLPTGHLWVPSKNVNPIGPAIWPAKAKLNKHICAKSFIIKINKSLMRGGRPATTISRPSHILLIFSSEPPQNPRPFVLKFLYLIDKIFFFNLATLGYKIWINQSIAMITLFWNLQTDENDVKLYLGKT